MKFHEYMESVYVASNLEVQREFSVSLQGKAQAAHGLIALHRTLAKLFFYPTLLFGFLLMKLNLSKQMDGARFLIEQAQARAKEELEAKKLKSVPVTNDSPTAG
jgi:hypothetical protein